MLEHQTSTEENAQILLARAAEWRNNSQQVDLNAESLRQLTESKGIDFATALLFDQIVSSSTHGPFIRQMEQLKQQNSKDTPKLNATVAVVPGAFYREHPETGADGQVMRDEAARHGCQAELIPTKSIGTPAENGRIICDWLANQCDSKIILASLSKGGADVKMALKEPDAPKAFQNVVAWLNVGGVLDGSPMAEWLLSRKLLTQLYRTIFWLRGQDFHFVRELDRRPGCSLDFKLQVPELMRIIHVVGFPLRQHLSSRRTRRWHRRLAPLGPNDSAVILSDLCKLPGLMFPVWGADHYLKSHWNPQSLITALLQYLGEELDLFQPVAAADREIA